MISQAKVAQGVIAGPGCAIAPGAYDPWSARLVERAGFAICYMTGFGVAAAHLGVPDIGLMTGSQMADCAARIADAVTIPVIADADTGYGNVLNMRHTVRAYCRAGVAGIQIEDQEFPKRCGHLDGKRVTPLAPMLDKIRAAKDGAGGDLLVVARTDARAVHGLAAALERGAAFRDAGADLVFIEAPQSEDELARVAGALADVPLVANMVEGGKTPYLSADRLGALGFSLAIFPISGLLAATRAVRECLGHLHRHGQADRAVLARFEDLHAVSGLDDYLAYGKAMEGSG